MNFDIQDLILLETIERTGSFSAAADALFRTRSAIAQHAKKLEEQMGFQLFDRSQYRPSLTPEGRIFLERGRPLLRGLERLKSEIHRVKQGWESEFSIAIDDVIPPENVFFLVEEFQKVAPFVTLRLTREVLNGCWDALRENRATLAIGTTGEPPVDLMCGQKHLGMIEFVLAVAKTHPLAQLQRPVRVEDLQVFPNVIISDTSQGIAKRTATLNTQSQLFVPTMEAKIKAQLMGLGIGHLPRFRIRHLLDKGEMVQLTLHEHEKNKSHFKIAWQANFPTPALEWFLNTLESKTVRNQIIGEQAFCPNVG